ncbi:AAEL008448-PA [Aedes aegypti]|uniref:Odorant receptor n=2 Tax=Aedes aegypti TaxID=7159 RepID=Q16YR8_AEDAE|nr:odorant receptor 15 [Aedes aegypti]EAT39781.2 AAEL008448-PA [Aedes aegypti]QHE66120.1 OR15 [Aedes aegypti]DAA80364.1 TPA_exp: odorant receptor 15 [Aedes aegypti]
MKYFELTEPEAAMPLALRLLETYGLRGGKRKFLQFQVTILWELLMIVIPKIVFGYRSQDLVIRGLSELLFQLHIMIRISIFAWHRFKYESLIDIIRKVYRKTFSTGGDPTSKSIILKFNQMINKQSKGYFLYIMGCVSLFSVAPVVQSVIIFMANQSRNGTEKAEYVTMMEQEFYGLDIRGNFGHYAIYVALAGLAHYYSASFFAVTGVIIICGVRCTILTFKLINVRLSKLHELPKQDIRDELREIIDLHVDALRCIQLLEQIANLAMVIQIIDCVLIWISMILYMRNNLGVDAISLMVLFVALTGETYALCDLLTQLTSESLAVTRAIIDCQWYSLPLDVQKSLSFVLFRAQRKEGITAAKFFFMDIERFGSVAQTSYSIYVVLKDQL